MSADKGHPTLNTQRILDGRYEVGELIGRGGMADVYLGRDSRLGRAVAIKVLRPDLARDPLFQSRFRREAQAVAGLNHSSIVSVYDTGDQASASGSPDDVRLPFIVMEFISGRTLRDLIKAGDISTDDAVDYTLGVLAALEYSHRSGIVHRDIKPANVMVTQDGHVKVMDFGIARAVADSAATMTQTQAVIGTAQYLSPEQARGETVDARSDLYSAACLLFEMLAGRPPFVGDSPVSVAYQHVREAPPKAASFNPEVTGALESVLERALAKDRNERYQSAHDFRDALLAARNGTPDDHRTAATQAVPQSPVSSAPIPDEEPRTRAMARVLEGGPLTSMSADDLEDAAEPPAEDTRNRHGERRGRRRAWIITLFAAIGLLLAAGGIYAYNLANQPPPPPATASIPEVEDMTQTEAINALLEKGFRAPATESQYSDTVESGRAIGTQPEAGSTVALDSDITLYISQGPSAVQIPDTLPGMSEAQARDTLRILGLQGGNTTAVNSATVPEGRVIETVPGVGTSVQTGSTVDLVLSSGKVSVPNVVDMSLEEAEAFLADPAYGLGTEVEEVENSVVEPGTVTSQSAQPGSDVPQGSTIKLTVAKAPSPSPSASPEPSESPSGPSSRRGGG
ncbi:Stk1 family PASTA domain-containing Ser/Thr kinase [Arthrobacter gandavensis]|uniref:Stk1 family PASTA domain-containing Ser/Thr kinase n=1 Tax=Arthrobacter gandavensis TaxID=169960 RepID=UPI00188F46FD|nr:Stk1 family PASTA domain-containing Ser/Thr kinase [Arthrobacter gandavensis]MBF4994593.1 Stk1 family PASTA domain-containing Ser/Thr kinase [Arthrobacter gandavensis]